MKIAKRYVIDNVTVDSSKLPNVLRLYPSVNERELLLLKDKDGAFPFFIKLSSSVPNSGFNNFNDILNNKKRRVSKEYIEENFWVYNIPTDYGHQSLSPGFDDFTTVCYDNDGYKIPQHFLAYIINYASKETFVIIPKNGSTVSIIKRIDILPSIYTDIDTDTYIPLTKNNDNDIYTVNMNSAEINSIDDVSVYFSYDSSVSSTKYKLQRSEYFIKIFTYNNTNLPLGIGQSSTYVAKQSSYTKLYGEVNINDELIVPPYLDVSNEDKEYLNISIQVNSITDHNKPIFLFLKNNKSGFEFIRNTYNFLKSLSLPLTEDIEVYSPLPNDSTKMRRLIQGIDFYIRDKKIFITPEPDDATVFDIYIRSQNQRVLSVPFTGVTEFDLVKFLYNLNIIDWNIDIINSKIDLYKDGLLVDTSSILVPSSRYEYFVYDIVLDNEIEQPADISEDEINDTIINSTNTFNNFEVISLLNYTIFTDPYLNTYGETSAYITAELPQEVFLLDRSLNIKVNDFDTDDEVNDITKWIREPSILPETRDFNGSSRVRHTLIDRDNNLMDTVINNFISEYNYYIFKNGVAPSTDDELAGRSLYRTLNQSKLTAIENNIATFKNNWKESITNYGDITNEMDTTTGLIENIGNFWMLVIKPSKTNSPFNIEYYGPNGQLKKKEYSCVATNGYYYSMPFFLDAFGDPGEYNEDIENETTFNRITNVAISYIDDSGSFDFLAVK
jgi:hypothetical protein